MALADRDLRIGTIDQSQHDAAVDSAFEDYSGDYTTISNTRRADATNAGVSYANSLTSFEKVHTLQSSWLQKSFVEDESQAHLDRVTAIADLDEL